MTEKTIDRNNLTTSDYWDRQWENTKLPSTLDVRKYPWRAFHELLGNILPVNEQHKVLEIGCAPGKWLLYFHTHFKYMLYGIEYSPVGYRKTVENLTAAGVSFRVLQEDFFSSSLTEKMDVVFSYGVIEHFDDTARAVRKHLDYLAPEGTLAVILPNFTGLYGMLQRLADKKILAGHKIVSLCEFRELMNETGMEEIAGSYMGIFNLGLINWSHTPRLFLHLINFINTAVHFAVARLHIKLETRMFSPYFIYVGKRKK